jgi:hypothetical protein
MKSTHGNQSSSDQHSFWRRKQYQYKATAKKCRTKLNGRGFRPESRAIGPSEQTLVRNKIK